MLSPEELEKGSIVVDKDSGATFYVFGSIYSIIYLICLNSFLGENLLKNNPSRLRHLKKYKKFSKYIANGKYELPDPFTLAEAIDIMETREFRKVHAELRGGIYKDVESLR